MMDTLANSNSYILRSYYRMSVAASAYIYSDKPGRRGAKCQQFHHADRSVSFF